MKVNISSGFGRDQLNVNGKHTIDLDDRDGPMMWLASDGEPCFAVQLKNGDSLDFLFTWDEVLEDSYNGDMTEEQTKLLEEIKEKFKKIYKIGHKGD